MYSLFPQSPVAVDMRIGETPSLLEYHLYGKQRNANKKNYDREQYRCKHFLYICGRKYKSLSDYKESFLCLILLFFTPGSDYCPCQRL
jgi:hypothetical protein